MRHGVSVVQLCAVLPGVWVVWVEEGAVMRQVEGAVAVVTPRARARSQRLGHYSTQRAPISRPIQRKAGVTVRYRECCSCCCLG